MKKIVISCVALAPLAFLGCKSRNFDKSQGKEFVQFNEVGKKTLGNYRLQRLKEHFDKLNVPEPKYRAELLELKLPGAKDDAENQFSVEVTFENLSTEQCKTLRSAYYLTDIACGENGVYPWDNNKYVYTMKDFLSPVMQATLNLTFNPERKELGNEPFTNEFGPQERQIAEALEANCWSTAYEVARQESQQYSVHVISSQDADKIFKNPSYTKFVVTGNRARLNTAIEKGGLGRFGELLIVRFNSDDEETGEARKGTIAHAAVFVDSNLLFERVGNDRYLPMRLATLDQVLKDYPDSAFSYEIRQVMQPFPHVSKIPDLQTKVENEGEGYYFRTTVMIKDFDLEKLGWEYRLPARAFKPILK